MKQKQPKEQKHLEAQKTDLIQSTFPNDVRLVLGYYTYHISPKAQPNLFQDILFQKEKSYLPRFSYRR